MGVSADHAATLDAFTKQNKISIPSSPTSAARCCPATTRWSPTSKSPIFRYAKRAYFVIDRNGVVRYMKIQDNALDLLDPAEVLKALKDSGA